MKKLFSLILGLVFVACTQDYSRPQVVTSIYKSSDGRCLYTIQPEGNQFYGNCNFHIGDTVVLQKK